MHLAARTRSERGGPRLLVDHDHTLGSSAQMCAEPHRGRKSSLACMRVHRRHQVTESRKPKAESRKQKAESPVPNRTRVGCLGSRARYHSATLPLETLTPVEKCHTFIGSCGRPGSVVDAAKSARHMAWRARITDGIGNESAMRGVRDGVAPSAAGLLGDCDDGTAHHSRQKISFFFLVLLTS